MMLHYLCSLSDMAAAMQHFHVAVFLKCRLSWQVCTLAANLSQFLLLADLFVCFIFKCGVFLDTSNTSRCCLREKLDSPDPSVVVCPNGSLGMFLLLVFPWKEADGWLHSPQAGSPLGCFSSSLFLLTNRALGAYQESGLLLEELLSSLETLTQSYCVSIRWELEEYCKVLYKLWLRHNPYMTTAEATVWAGHCK